MMRRWTLLLAAALTACINENGPNNNGGGFGPLPVPTGLRYEVTPGGPGNVPVATLLEWDLVDDPAVVAFNVYSRTTSSGSWGLRGTTTSPSFHDYGVPELEYFVTSVDIDGFESAPSGSVRIDERLTLPRVTSLTPTSLDGAIALFWSDNPFEADPQGFRNYRVYSTTYDLDTDRCGAAWTLEGTTVAPEFIAGVLPNGVPRCFGVSAVTVEGFESLWSPIVDDTPRPESRNVAIQASEVSATASGFRFWRDFNNNNVAERSELGLVVAGNATEADFSIERDATNAMFLTPQRAEVNVAVYGTGPVPDLTSIDRAPANGYARVPIELQPGHGYVARIGGASDGFYRYGAVRVTHVGRDFIILDWSFQTDPGNVELIRR